MWMEAGTELFLTTLDGLGDLDGPSALPGWTRKHVAAHVAANADALLNLVRWARTGEETPMYASPEQRNRDIEEGATKPADTLRKWARSSAERLADGLAGLSATQLTQMVRTAQGRLVPASEVPWMRSREVLVHAVDLDAGVTFADLPEDFLVALIGDIAAKRAGPALSVRATDGPYSWTVTGSGPPSEVVGSIADLATYLAGRHPIRVAGPELPRWL